jgi:hypothetical protein
MRVTVRPFLTTGVALMAASVIAVTPITASPAEVPGHAVRAPTVELAAVPAPGSIATQIALNQVGSFLSVALVVSGAGMIFSALNPPHVYAVSPVTEANRERKVRTESPDFSPQPVAAEEPADDTPAGDETMDVEDVATQPVSAT